MVTQNPVNVPDHVLEKCIDGLLADATREVLAEDIAEQEACARLAKLPGATWVYASVNVGYSVPSRIADFDRINYNAHVDGPIGLSLRVTSEVSLLAAVEEVEQKYADATKKAERKATIAARIEREMAELEAAEKSLTTHATAPQVPEDLAESVAAKFKDITGKDINAPECDRPEDKIVYTGKPGGDFEAIGEIDPYDGVTPADGGGR